MAAPTGGLKRGREQAIPDDPSSLPPPKYSRTEDEKAQDIAQSSLTDSTEFESPPHSPIPMRSRAAFPANRGFIVTQLFRRETGMSHQLDNPKVWWTKGLSYYEQEEHEKALRCFTYAEACFHKTGFLVHPMLFHNLGQSAYDLGRYAEAYQAFQKHGLVCPKYEAEGLLLSALCQARRGEWRSFGRLMQEFEQLCNFWFLIQPASCPLSQQEYDDFRQVCDYAIDELNEFLEHPDPAIQHKVRLVTFILFYALGEPTKTLEYARQVIEIDEDSGVMLNLLHYLKYGSPQQKERVITVIQEENLRVELPIIKLLFNEGLKNQNLRALQLAAVFLQSKLDHPDLSEQERIYALTHLFFCMLAMERRTEALHFAEQLKLLAPQTAQVLIDLYQMSTNPALDLASFRYALGSKDVYLADPVIFRFIAKQIEQTTIPDKVEWADQFKNRAQRFLTIL